MTYKKLDFEVTKFKKFGGENITDIVSYVKDYVKTGDDMRIFVGCDSQQKRKHTLYALTIVLHDASLHNGAHVLFMRIRSHKERDIFTRMMNESIYSLDLSLWLDEELDGHYTMPDFGKCDYDGSIPTKKIEIHVDINPVEGLNKQNKSNVAYKAVMGMISGSGFNVKCKPNAPAASYAADLLVR